MKQDNILLLDKNQPTCLQQQTNICLAVTDTHKTNSCNHLYYFQCRLASEGIVMLGVTLCVCVCVHHISPGAS